MMTLSIFCKETNACKHLYLLSYVMSVTVGMVEIFTQIYVSIVPKYKENTITILQNIIPDVWYIQ